MKTILAFLSMAFALTAMAESPRRPPSQEAEFNVVMSKFCAGLPRLTLGVIEAMGAKLEVNPDTIKMKRVNLLLDTADKSALGKCIGVFYSPRGSHSCELEFDSKGIVQKACELGLPGYSLTYTEERRMQIFWSSDALKPTEAYDRDGNPVKGGWAGRDKYAPPARGTVDPSEFRSQPPR